MCFSRARFVAKNFSSRLHRARVLYSLLPVPPTPLLPTRSRPHRHRVSCDNIPKYKAPRRVGRQRRAFYSVWHAAAARLRSHARRGTLQIFRPTCVFYMPSTRRLCQMSNEYTHRHSHAHTHTLSHTHIHVALTQHTHIHVRCICI